MYLHSLNKSALDIFLNYEIQFNVKTLDMSISFYNSDKNVLLFLVLVACTKKFNVDYIIYCRILDIENKDFVLFNTFD